MAIWTHLRFNMDYKGCPCNYKMQGTQNPPKIQRLWISFLALPVKSAPSSISPRASGSWKLSSWYRLLPALFSLNIFVIGNVVIFFEDISFKNLYTALNGLTNWSGKLKRLTEYPQNYFSRLERTLLKFYRLCQNLKVTFQNARFAPWVDLAGRKSITASRRRRRRGHLRFGVWRAGHGRAGGGRGGRPEGRVLADVLRLASLLLLLLRLHTSFPCWRYVRLLTGRGKRILAQTEYRAIRKYWMLDSIIWPQTTE